MSDYGPLMVIEWEDSCGHTRGPWHAREDVEQLTPSIIRSTGWKLSESRTHLIIVAHVSEGDQVSGEMCIPCSAIKRRWVLRDPPQRKRRK